MLSKPLGRPVVHEGLPAPPSKKEGLLGVLGGDGQRLMLLLKKDPAVLTMIASGAILYKRRGCRASLESFPPRPPLCVGP